MEQGLIDAGTRLLQTVGFPILVAGWFMFRMEKRLDAMNESLGRIAVLLASLNKEGES